MSADSKIEWTDKTWNPVRGCSRISPGCGGAAGVGGCYAEKVAGRFSGPGLAYEGLATMGKNGARWTGKVRLIPEALAEPLHWRKPLRIFVNSMSDLFHESLTDEQIAAVFGVMAACPQHVFQVLTKRAARMARWFEWVAGMPLVGADMLPPWYVCIDCAEHFGAGARGRVAPPYPWPLPSVWIGVSVEDQQRADERIPHLLRVPAAVRFLSVEPLLGAIDLTAWMVKSVDLMRGAEKLETIDMGPRLDWVIVGGESGPGARPMDEAWARSIRDQCTAAGVPFFYKQRLDGKRKVSLPMLDGRQWAEFPRA